MSSTQEQQMQSRHPSLAARGYYDPLLGYDVSHILPRHVGSRVITLEEGDECWRPACDVFETDDSLVVHCDLPGVPRDEIKIDVRGNALYIYGEHKGVEGFQAASSQVRERGLQQFRKIIKLPDEVDHNVAHAKASYSNGLLEVCVPKMDVPTHSIKIE